MVKYLDVTKESKNDGIFSELYKEFNIEWLKDDVTNLDKLFELLYGNHELSPVLTVDWYEVGPDFVLSHAAAVLSVDFSYKWDNLKKLYDDDFSASSVENYEENTKDKNKLTHNLSAYDSDELTADNSDDEDNEKNRSYSLNKKDGNFLKNTINLLQENSLYGTMMLDAKDVMFKQVY